MTRIPALDAARGLMLVLMALTHLPTPVAKWSSQPFGFVSNAEGFVFLSAVLVGLVYRQRAAQGLWAVSQPLWRRSLQLYRYHLLTLACAFTVGAWLAMTGQRPALANLLDHFLADPGRALPQALLTTYRPPLMDILPMYVGYIALAPVLLWWGVRRGWSLLLLGSAALWLAAQSGLREWMHEIAIAALPMWIPSPRHTGAFNIYAWQLVWVYGLWIGQRHASIAPRPLRIPRAALGTATVVAIFLLVLRYVAGSESDAPHWWIFVTNKWDLGALRVLGFTCLVLLTMRWGSACARHVPTSALQLLGRSSLAVFTAHVLACILVAGIMPSGDRAPGIGWQAAVISFTFAVMFSTALLHQRRRSAAGARRTRRVPA